jgi:hypothetical protein
MELNKECFSATHQLATCKTVYKIEEQIFFLKKKLQSQRMTDCHEPPLIDSRFGKSRAFFFFFFFFFACSCQFVLTLWGLAGTTSPEF